jgi:chromosomal replication initiator protein
LTAFGGFDRRHTNVEAFYDFMLSFFIPEAAMTTIWEEIKDQIRGVIPEKSFSLWINPLTLLEQSDDAIVLGCPNKFSLNWVTENYIPLFQENLDRMGEKNCKLALRVVSPSSAPPPALVEDPRQLTLPNIPSNENGGPRALNQDFTFDRFVVGRCNEFAYAASKALAIEGQFPCSSLFIVAKTGLGKSHLSQATAHALLESNPRLKVIYITAEDFVNEMIFALKNHRIDEFKNKYRRSCDVLLLEEIHFLSGKEKTQLELGYTLDALANDRKRIIFTSSLLPKDIPHLNRDLASRLTSGIITTLDTPDYETRVKIIERKSSEHGLALSHEIFHLLAKDLTGDVRQMESALRCLKAKADLMKAIIDPDLAKEILLCHMPSQKLLTLEDVKAMVCQYFKIDPALLSSKSRKKIHAYPRNVYVYLCRQHTDRTVEEIGRSLSRNHSTVLYASEVIEHKMKMDKRVKNQIEFLSTKLKEMKK